MAITDHVGILTTKDGDGNIRRLYPVTKVEAIEGFSGSMMIKFEDVSEYFNASADTHNWLFTMVGVNPDDNGKIMQVVDGKWALVSMAGNGTVKTINGVSPDESGNVLLYGDTTAIATVVDEAVTVVNVGGDLGGFIQSMDRTVFVEGATFSVLLNGVPYIGLCSYQAPGVNADGSAPMLIMTDSGQVVAMVGFMEGMGNGIFFSGMPVTAGDSVSVIITYTVKTEKKIPAKYLESPSVEEVKTLIDEYIEEALGGEY